jgi:hypothetical protein
VISHEKISLAIDMKVEIFFKPFYFSGYLLDIVVETWEKKLFIYLFQNLAKFRVIYFLFYGKILCMG